MTAETTTNTVDITTETLGGTTPGGLKKTMRLLYVYTLATGAIYTFLCYWEAYSCRIAVRAPRSDS